MSEKNQLLKILEKSPDGSPFRARKPDFIDPVYAVGLGRAVVVTFLAGLAPCFDFLDGAWNSFE